MTHYSVQPRYRIFVKGYGFFSFAKNMGKNICKETASKRTILKTAEANGDLIRKKIAGNYKSLKKFTTK